MGASYLKITQVSKSELNKSEKHTWLFPQLLEYSDDFIFQDRVLPHWYNNSWMTHSSDHSFIVIHSMSFFHCHSWMTILKMIESTDTETLSYTLGLQDLQTFTPCDFLCGYMKDCFVPPFFHDLDKHQNQHEWLQLKMLTCVKCGMNLAITLMLSMRLVEDTEDL